MRKPIKICYILPEYNKNTDSHFFHIYEFLQEASKHLDIFLIIEKSSVLAKDVKITEKVYVQKYRFLPLRFLESFFVVLKARRIGYKNFYTHYCYIGAINAGIISHLFGGKSYYWNCAMNWLFKQKDASKIGYKLSLKFSHFLVTGSETMKQGYVEHYHLDPSRVKVMPNWINLNRFQPTADHPQGGKHQVVKTLLFVHWLSARKGADMIIPIVLTLKSLIGDFKLIVVGDGPKKEELIVGTKEHGLESHIEIIGAVPNKNLSDYYQKADIFVMPSLEEGFPRVLLEAMAMGVPYVASDVGAVREISPEIAQRFLVKPGDAEMFAHKIEALLSDEKTYNNFRKEELQKVKEYSLEVVINKFIELFK